MELNEHASYPLGEYLYYTQSERESELPKDLINNTWKSDAKEIDILNIIQNPYWVKFSLHNRASNKEAFFILMDSQFIFSMEAFYVQNGKVIDTKVDGYLHEEKDRVCYSSDMVLPIQIKKGETVDVYMRIRNFNLLIAPSKIMTKSELVHHNAQYNLWQGVFFGIMVVMLFFNLIIYFITKFRPYLFYVSYVFGLIIFTLFYHGFMMKIEFFDNYESWVFLFLGNAVVLIFLILFVKEFLHLKTNLPKTDKILSYYLYIIYALFGIFSMVYLTHHYYYAQLAVTAIVLFLPFYAVPMTYSIYYLAYKGLSSAKYFALVWAFILFCILFLGILPFLVGVNLLSYTVLMNLVQSIFVFEAILFSIILAFRIKTIEKEKEEQKKILIQQNKLASMGKMINSIAHQWRQPLNVINLIGFTIESHYRHNKLTPELMTKNIDEIENITQYLSSTISDFMNFFRPDKEKQYFHIHESVDKALNILTLSKDEVDIEIESYFHDRIYGFESEFIQCIISVLNNANDAMMERNIENPKINIIIEETDGKVRTTICDNGGGVVIETLQKLSEPYFTTKHQSQGTGLGLYITTMIIEKSMNGNVEITNQKDGLCVTFVLPLSENL